jgi:hypothetical protein
VWQHTKESFSALRSKAPDFCDFMISGVAPVVILLFPVLFMHPDEPGPQTLPGRLSSVLVLSASRSITDQRGENAFDKRRCVLA